MLILHDTEYYESRKPREDLGTWGNFKRFLWDSEKRTFLDRDGRGWADALLFHAVFFAVVFSFFALHLWILFIYVYSMETPQPFSYMHSRAIMDENRMPVTLRSSVSGPGLSFQPNILSPLSSPIILLDDAQASKYIEKLDNFLINYKQNRKYYADKCDQAGRIVGKPCYFNISALNECSISPYGYVELEPCVVISVNKMLRWIPNCYNATSELPIAMPEWLKNHVRRSTKTYVWFSCDAANDADREHVGEIRYIPRPGFPVEYFPYTGNKYHLSPLLAVKFSNITANRLVSVKCTAWARNLYSRLGYSLSFQMIIGKSSFSKQVYSPMFTRSHVFARRGVSGN